MRLWGKATILFLAMPFIIFDMLLGDIHCLSHAPFEKTFTIQPQNWQLLCLSVLESHVLSVRGWGQQHARTVWPLGLDLTPLYLALNMKLCGKKQANCGQICVHIIPSCASALLMLVDNSNAKRITNYQWKRLWISMDNKQWSIALHMNCAKSCLES